MSDAPRDPLGFWHELKRRRVTRVALAYAVVAWAIIEIAETTFPYLRIPEWAITLVIVLAALGFPVALVLAWAFEITPDGVRRTVTDGTPRVRPPRRSRTVVAVVGVALLIAGILALRAMRDGAPAAADGATADPAAIAVLPFSVSADGDRDLSEGMVSLLATKLDGAGDLRTIDPHALLSLIERESLPIASPEDGSRVAGRLGAGQFVLGNVVHFGNRLGIVATLYHVDRPGSPIVEGSVEGTVDQLFEKVDELAAQLLGGMTGGPSARVRQIAAVTTSSLPALKAFLEGERLARRAQFGAAVAALRRAVELDSMFALAHYRLAIAAEWNLQDDLARAAAEEAVRRASRLGERDRRLLDAFLVRRRGENAAAERLYRSILGTYPDEMEAWVDLGEILFHAGPMRGESFSGSRDAMERILSFEPTHSTTLIHLARLAAFEGRLAELDSLAERFLSLNPDADRSYEIRALQAFAHDDAVREQAVLDERQANDLSVALAVWDVAVFARDIEGAAELSRRLAEPVRSPEGRTLGLAWLAHMRLASGRLDDAYAALDSLASFNPGTAAEYRALFAVLPFLPPDADRMRRAFDELRRVDPNTIPRSDNPSVVFTAHDRIHPAIRLYLLGRLSARLGDARAAGAYADSVQSADVPATAGSLADDLARSVRAEIARDAGRLEDALTLLEGARMETWYGQTLASPFYSQVLERFMRAETLRELGRGEEALPWYEHIAELSPFEAPYRAIAHERQAEIHRAAGREAEAREHQQQAAALLAHADSAQRPTNRR